MHIDILTLFPTMFDGPLSESIIKRAQGKELVTIKIHNIRDWSTDKHQSVDDSPYGGGAGMVMRVDIIVSALESILNADLTHHDPTTKIFLMSAKGPVFTQAQAVELSQTCQRLVLIAGHYEGVDERLLHFIDGELSIGHYVLTGGELPAMVIADAVIRLLPGVITKESIVDESYTNPDELEYPQYTRPEEFRSLTVPDVLKSGNHQAIAQWRGKQKRKVNLSG